MALPIADEEEKAMFELRLQVGEEERVYPVYSARDNVREIKEILERERLTKL